MEVLYKNQSRELPIRVFYTGSDAIERGIGLCYDLDYLTTTTDETAADAFQARGKVVAKPDTTNNLAFAGVTAAAYAAKSGGQFIEIYEPGSWCMIQTAIATTINSTRLTCIASSAAAVAGRWGAGALPGRGSALALQTMANASGNPLVSSIAGAAAYTSATGSIACTGAFTNAVAGDKVIVLAGGVANAATKGVYYIKTRTDADNAIVSATLGGAACGTDLAANAAKLAIYVVPALPKFILAYLYDGEESGLQEFDIPVSAAVTNPMVGGKTNLMGNVTIANSHVPPLADGMYVGQMKMVQLNGALTTGSYVITPASLGLAPDGTIAVTAALQASLGQAILRWTGQKWDIVSVNTAAEAT